MYRLIIFRGYNYVTSTCILSSISTTSGNYLLKLTIYLVKEYLMFVKKKRIFVSIYQCEFGHFKSFNSKHVRTCASISNHYAKLIFIFYFILSMKFLRFPSCASKIWHVMLLYEYLKLSNRELIKDTEIMILKMVWLIKCWWKWN